MNKEIKCSNCGASVLEDSLNGRLLEVSGDEHTHQTASHFASEPEQNTTDLDDRTLDSFLNLGMLSSLSDDTSDGGDTL